MSANQVNVVRRFYELAERVIRVAQQEPGRLRSSGIRSLEGASETFELIDENVTWTNLWHPQPWRGRDGVAQSVTEWIDIMGGEGAWRWESLGFEPLRGGVVLGHFRAFQRGRVSGAETSAALWNTYLIRNGRIANYREHLSRDDALRTAERLANSHQPAE
jgi:ketosteroid isomerase-like protein